MNASGRDTPEFPESWDRPARPGRSTWAVEPDQRPAGEMSIVTAHAIDAPEQLNAVLADGFRRGDPDAVAGVYDDDAVLVMPPDGQTVRGREAIRAAVAPLVALRPQFSSVVRATLRAGDLALTHAQWRMAVTQPDGRRQELSGQGTIVSRRRSDGNWRIVLDDPMGPR
jgi:uncharacterized protein (TIGR02246 family)